MPDALHRWAARRWHAATSMDGRLDDHETRERQMFVILSGMVAALCAAGVLYTSITLPTKPVLLILGEMLVLIPSLGIATRILCGGTTTRPVKCIALLSCSLGLMMVDLTARATYGTIWPAYLLVLDGLLLLRIDSRFTTRFLGCLTVWIAVVCADEQLRYGLLDVPGTASYERRREIAEELYNCDKPPCRQHDAFLLGLFALCVIFFNFIAMRGLSGQLLREQAALEQTVAVLRRVARLASECDVDSVGSALDAADDTALPDAALRALRSLEAGLRAHRPFLPPAVLQHGEAQRLPPAHTPLPPPTAPGASHEVTVAFTDVHHGARLWGAAPDAMRHAVRTHHAVLREALRATGGYEVKAVGDATMSAFATTAAGVNFGIRTQLALLRADWAAPLLDIPLCARNGIWAGLPLRIGISTGPLTAEANTLTGRTDYSGRAVLEAACLESSCIPGAVAVRSDLWEHLESTCVPSVAGEAKALCLKGAQQQASVSVRHVWPESLAERRIRPLQAALPTPTPPAVPTPPHHLPPLQQQGHAATLGVLQFSAGLCRDTAASLNHSIAACMPVLERSGGTILGMQGGSLCAAWNVCRPQAAHAESALQFVRILRGILGAGTLAAGLATGTVQYGAVGTDRHSFVTAVGSPQQASWELCGMAVRDHLGCLYAPLSLAAGPHGGAPGLPAALRPQLLPLQGRHVAGVGGEMCCLFQLVPDVDQVAL